MVVSCFCGARFEFTFDTVTCPDCGAIAILPRTTKRDQDAMEADLAALIEEHNPQI